MTKLALSLICSSFLFSLACAEESYELGAVEITAKKAVDSNPSISIVDAKDMKDSNSDNMAQAIRYVPGVYMHEATDSRGEPGLNIRGYSGTQIGLFLDGIPVMSIYDRQTDFSQYVNSNISSISVSKGFTSPVYGMNTIGGAINIITAKPKDKFELSLRSKYISTDEIQTGFNIGTNQGSYYLSVDYSYTDRFSYPISKDYKEVLTDKGATYQKEGGKKTNAYYHNETLKLKAGVLNENHEYSLNYIYQTGDKGGLLSDDTGGRWWEWPNYDKRTIYLLGNSYFSPKLSLNTRLYYDAFFNKLNIYGKASSNVRPQKINSISVYDDDTIGGIFTLNYDINDNSNAKFGINLKRDHHLGKDGNGVKDSDLTELNTSIFAQYAHRFDRLRFIVAASYDRLDGLDVYLNKSNKTNNTETNINGNLSWQGILYYDLNENQNIHFALGKRANMPSLKDRYSSKWGNYMINPDLKVESAINYELGYDLNLTNTKFSANVFYNDLSNMFTEEFVTTGVSASDCDNYSSNGKNGSSSGCYKRTNVDNGYATGLELAFEQNVLDTLTIGANYSYIYKKAQGSSDDNNAAGTKITDYPNHIFNAKVAFKASEKLELIAFGVLESAKYYADSSTYKMSNNYFSLDIVGNYELDKNFMVSAGVTNLTDRDNYSGYLDGGTYHFAGRRFFVGLDYKY